MKRWSPSEDRLLRDLYPADGILAVVKATGRAWRAVKMRAQRLGVVLKPHWTPEEEARLRELWAMVLPLQDIAEAMGRSEMAVYQRAYRLDLPAGCPAGHEWLSNAARRAGVAPPTLVSIMRWAKLPIHKSITPPKPSRRKRRRKRPGHPVRLQWRFVESADVDEAMRRWNETETIRSACRRLHVSVERLSRQLRVIGIHGQGHGKHVRITESDLRKAGVAA